MERLEHWFAPDHQREKLYRAEKVLPNTWREDTHLRTNPQVETWVKKIVRKPWFKQRWPHVKDCRVEKPSGGADAEGEFDHRDGANLALPRWCRSELGVLHELAHACVYQTGTRQGHGPEYAGAYLFLVEKIRGQEEARVLRESFDKHKVKYVYPKTTKEYRRRQAKKKQAAHRVGV